MVSPCWKMEVNILLGLPGVGKSRHVKDLAPDAYWKAPNKWWDGYSGQETVVLDDFYGWLPFDFLLRLLDRYPLRVEYKGGTTDFTSKTIWITSNKKPCDWYDGEKCNVRALYRRFTVFSYMKEVEGVIGLYDVRAPKFPINC